MWIREEKNDSRIYILQEHELGWLEHFIVQLDPLRKGNKRIRLKSYILSNIELVRRIYRVFPGDCSWTEIQENLYSGPHRINEESLAKN